VSVQQFVRERGQARSRLRVALVIAAAAGVAGAYANGLSATTGRAKTQTYQGPTGADRGLNPDCG
jgi:hypothetical protein